jgi:hypothetical protein
VLNVQIFYAIFALCVGYALAKGGPPERTGAAIMVVAYLLSSILLSAPSGRFGSVELGIFYVDLAILIAFIVLALRAERYWPLWVAALQIIGVGGHLVKLVDLGTVRGAYAFLLAVWSYPQLLLLAIGTYRHQQRLARNSADPSWSTFSARSERAPPAGPTA